jgi:glutathionyl-hydroquinone reductase
MNRTDYIDIIRLLSIIEGFSRANSQTKFLPDDIDDEIQRIIDMLIEQINSIKEPKS